jgi:hypothetical protein
MTTQREKSEWESEERGRGATKKEQIISLYRAGITEVGDLAMIVGARPSYVASVLQEAEHLPSYFDLYTTTAQPMNVYSKFFAKKLGFKDLEAAERSVELLDHYYRQFELARDRAGQHHALLLALTMSSRARWTGKTAEAEVFRNWLTTRLHEAEPEPDTGPSAERKLAIRR